MKDFKFKELSIADLKQINGGVFLPIVYALAGTIIINELYSSSWDSVKEAWDRGWKAGGGK